MRADDRAAPLPPSGRLRVEPAPFLDDFAPLALAPPERRPALLVSAGPVGPGARFSVAAIDPIAELIADSPLAPLRARACARAASAGAKAEFDSLGDALEFGFAAIGGAAAGGETSEELEGAFAGGWIGAIAYEFGARFERMPTRPTDEPALRLGLYPSAYVADRVLRRAWFAHRTELDPAIAGDGALGAAREAALREWVLDAVRRAESGVAPASPPALAPAASDSSDWREGWTASIPPDAYFAAVERVREYERAGDIYQANLTVRHERPCPRPAGEIFARLLAANPAPMAAFLGWPEFALASSSPETLLDLRRARDDRGAVCETRPIKGTIARPRDPAANPEADREAALRLLASAKDRAEHVMIVDLERNDLGRVCRPGSVRVDPLMAVESVEGLHHLVSAARGRLREGLRAADALAALFPGGSIVGAPKVRAMEILAELEPVPRGFYTGAIGWFGPEGDARLNLAIRTATIAGGKARIAVGGGIVADSSPEGEHEECRIKGERMAASFLPPIAR